ncbi:hypothetical protein TNCV_3858751 [Trichonephila clavipes]|nr:hypothetical protein TNCV_3858751 [Trichonephila clavipes]
MKNLPLSPDWESYLKETHFTLFKEVQANMERILNGRPKTTFQNCYQQWQYRTYMYSDEDIKLSESDCDKSEEKSDVIDNIPVYPDIYVVRDGAEVITHNSIVPSRFATAVVQQASRNNIALTAKEIESSSSPNKVSENHTSKMEAKNENKIKQEENLDADEEKLKQPITIIKNDIRFEDLQTFSKNIAWKYPSKNSLEILKVRAIPSKYQRNRKSYL